MTTTKTPPGALPRPRREPREVTTAERATRADWERITDRLGALDGPAAANAWAVLGQFLVSYETQVPRQRVSAGQTIRSEAK